MALLVGFGAIYHYFEKVRIPLSFGMLKKKKSFEKKIYCEAVSNVGSTGVMKIGILIPCRDEAQRGDLSQKLPRIKSAFLTSIDYVQVAAWIQEGNFSAVKQAYLTVINRFSNQPVKEIYFHSLNYF